MTVSFQVKRQTVLGRDAAGTEGEMRVNENIPWADIFWFSSKTALHW